MTLGNIIYGYSGMVDFDITAAATYPMIRFTLERNAILRMEFNVDMEELEKTGSAYGYQISIDGVQVARQVTDFEANKWIGNPTNTPIEWLLPAGRDCNIVVLNPEAAATLLKANAVILGQYV